MPLHHMAGPLFDLSIQSTHEGGLPIAENQLALESPSTAAHYKLLHGNLSNRPPSRTTLDRFYNTETPASNLETFVKNQFGRLVTLLIWSAR